MDEVRESVGGGGSLEAELRESRGLERLMVDNGGELWAEGRGRGCLAFEKGLILTLVIGVFLPVSSGDRFEVCSLCGVCVAHDSRNFRPFGYE